MWFFCSSAKPLGCEDWTRVGFLPGEYGGRTCLDKAHWQELGSLAWEWLKPWTMKLPTTGRKWKVRVLIGKDKGKQLAELWSWIISYGNSRMRVKRVKKSECRMFELWFQRKTESGGIQDLSQNEEGVNWSKLKITLPWEKIPMAIWRVHRSEEMLNSCSEEAFMHRSWIKYLNCTFEDKKK